MVAVIHDSQLTTQDSRLITHRPPLTIPRRSSPIKASPLIAKPKEKDLPIFI
jgi:hypothetical protein